MAVDHFGDFGFVVCGNASHIVVDGWDHGNRLFGHIHVGEDFCSLGYPG